MPFATGFWEAISQSLRGRYRVVTRPSVSGTSQARYKRRQMGGKLPFGAVASDHEAQ